MPPTASPPTTARPDGLAQPARARAMVSIILGLMAAVLQASVVNLALPDIGRELGASPARSIWVVNAFQIATLVMLLPLASFGDRVGYRRVYLSGMALFTLSSFGAMLADSIETLIVARAVQGLGAAGVMSVNSALVRQIYPAARLGSGMAINSMVVASSAVAGPSVAAAVLSVGSWPWLFAVNIPVGIAAWALGRRFLPDRRPEAAARERFSALDVLLNVLMFALVFIGAQGLGAAGGSGAGAGAGAPWRAWGLLGAGLVVGAVYLRRQARLAAPMFPVDLLRRPVFALSMCTSIGAFCAQTLAYIALPFLLLETYGRSHAEAGLLITVWPLGIVALAPIAGRLVGRYPDGLLGGVGLVLMAVGLGLLAALPAQPANAEIVWRLMLCGAGFGLFQTPNNHTIVTSAPRHRSGAASGMLGTARITGQTVGAVLLALIFVIHDRHDGSAETAALLLATVLALVASVFSVLRIGRGVASGRPM